MKIPHYLDKKWIWITPLRTKWSPPPLDEAYTIDVERVFTKFVRASAYHIDYSDDIDMTGDIYVIVQFDISNLEKEIEFAKKVKALGKKLIVCYSADMRFLIGNCFISPQGTLYTELGKYADVILSGMGRKNNIYGRYSDKVIEWALPMERLNFSNRSYEEREIDVLMSGSVGLDSFAFELEFMLMLKEKYPNIKIMHSSQTQHREYMQKFSHLDITFVHEFLANIMTNAKCYINLEVRPRGARVGLDAFYCRTPMMLCESTLYSELLPDFSYPMTLDFRQILDKYDKLRNTPYDILLNEMETNAENKFYFDVIIGELMSRLYNT